MNFDYNEEQQLLAASVKRFIDKDYTFEARKKIVASNEGYSHAIWSTFAEIGLLGLPFSPDVGGYGGGAVDLMSVMEAIGEALVVEPYLSTVGLGAQFVARAGTTARQQAILPLVGAGSRCYFVLPFEGRNIWGATAGILLNLAEVLAD